MEVNYTFAAIFNQKMEVKWNQMVVKLYLIIVLINFE